MTSRSQMLDLAVPVHELPRWIWLLSFFLLVIPITPYVIAHGMLALLYGMGTPWVLVGFVVLIVAHEAIHAIGWKLASGLPWSSFRFGFAWRGLAPYCHCTQPMNVVPYRIGGILPLIFTGILPWLVGLALADAALVFIGAMLIMGAVGDIYVLWSLRAVPSTAQVIDHESKVGCVVLLDS